MGSDQTGAANVLLRRSFRFPHGEARDLITTCPRVIALPWREPPPANLPEYRVRADIVGDPYLSKSGAVTRKTFLTECLPLRIR